HLDALQADIEARGGLGGIALTHSHSDHSEALTALRVRNLDPPVAAARAGADVLLRDGTQFGPLVSLPTPGHAPDHMAFLVADVCFTGDAVLGEGSVFVSPYRGSLNSYLAALERLQALDLALLCPGHGPPITDPHAKLSGYLEHRRARERMLLEALERGLRSAADLLDFAWADVSEHLRPAATLSLAAHLDKLAEQGLLPAGVERPNPAGHPEAH
ncbi:MAG: MBL fold metallo-hydrolase, partial [Solirubrobacteraceae bacterium]